MKTHGRSKVIAMAINFAGKCNLNMVSESDWEDYDENKWTQVIKYSQDK